MSRPTPLAAHAARSFAFLLLAGSVLAVSVPVAVRGQPPAPKQPKEKTADAPEMKLRWEIEPKKQLDNPELYFDFEGRTLVFTGRQQVEAQAYNPATGKLGFELPVPPDVKGSNMHHFRLEKGRFAFQSGNSAERELVVWDATTGATGRIPLPKPGTGLLSINVSPNGRFLATGEWTRAKSGSIPTTPLRVVDAKTNKAVVSFEGLSGQTAFTADSSRVLTVDVANRFRWFKLPSGEADGEWAFERDSGRNPPHLMGMSADGGAVLYYGTPGKRPRGIHLLDGKTGEVLHSFAQGYFPLAGFVSPDGGSVVLVREANGGTTHTLELLDTRGTLLGKATIPARVRQRHLLPAIAVSWEARAVATYHFEMNKLAVYDLPRTAGIAAAARPASRDAGAVKNRAPVPGDAAVAKAEAGIRQILKDEYARKQPAERKALAQKLLTLAAETPDDPAARYVMLRDAQELAVGVADPALALQAIEGLAQWYHVEGSAQQFAALEKILAAASSLTTVKSVVEFAGPASDAAADADEFDDAVQFAQLAVAAVRKGKLGQAAGDEAEYRLNQAKKARDAFAAVRPAVDRLKASPDDPAANSTVGKYRCFVQHRWDEGLKHLARGQDAALKAVAELDLAAPRTGIPDDAKVADAWWEYAQTASPSEQWAAQVRTRYWYARSIPGLTGLNKARAETRLAFTAGGNEYRPGLVCELSAKQPTVLKGTKARIDPVVDFSGGEFAAAGKTTDLTVKWTGVIAPPRAGRYTIIARTADVVRVRIDNKLVIDTSAKGAKREAQVTLGERATPIVIEYTAPNTNRHLLQLMWALPGRSDDQFVPAEYLFHDKRSEALLGK